MPDIRDWYDDLLELGVDLSTEKVSGDEVQYTCPFCSGDRKKNREKCFHINAEKGAWRCWHCDETGGFAPSETYRRQRQHRTPRTRIDPKPDITPGTSINDRHAEWLANRAIPMSIPRTFGAYSDGNALAIPYYRDGSILHVKYRGWDDKTQSYKKFWSTKGTNAPIYGLDHIGNATTIFITEGELDVWALAVAGITAVSIPNGASDTRLASLDNISSYLNDTRKIVIATDNDEKGDNIGAEIERRLGSHRVWRVDWPNDCKDANDVLLNHGVEGLFALQAGAWQPPVEGIVTGDMLTDDMIRMYEQGEDPGTPCGVSGLDSIYRVGEGMMTIVTGHSQSGKSVFLNWMLVNMARTQGWKIGIFSPEMQPLRLYQKLVIKQYAGAPFDEGPTPRMTRAEMLSAHRWAQDHFYYTLPENPTVDTIIDRMTTSILRYGLRGCVVDPWNEIAHARPPGMNESEYVSFALQKFRTCARNHGIHLWIVAHPTKMAADENGKEQIPTLTSISGSINFRNKADFGLTVWRDLTLDRNDPAALETTVYVTKSKWREVAEHGAAATFRFSKTTEQYWFVRETQ